MSSQSQFVQDLVKEELKFLEDNLNDFSVGEDCFCAGYFTGDSEAFEDFLDK